MTRNVFPVVMFFFANNPMLFVNLMIEMTMGSRLLQIGTTRNPFSKGVDQEILPFRPMGVESESARINYSLLMMNECGFKAPAMCVC